MAVSGVTDHEDTLFAIENYKNYERMDFKTRMEITYEMNVDMLEVSRTVYSTFMLLGDIGGF